MYREQKQLLTYNKDAMEDREVKVTNALRHRGRRTGEHNKAGKLVMGLVMDHRNKRFSSDEKTKAKTRKKKHLYGEADRNIATALEALKKAEQEKTTRTEAFAKCKNCCVESEKRRFKNEGSCTATLHKMKALQILLAKQWAGNK